MADCILFRMVLFPCQYVDTSLRKKVEKWRDITGSNMPDDFQDEIQVQNGGNT